MKLEIDLRSDTVTRPTSGMREAMQEAQVGDDVYEEDPSVNALQNKLAQMFGMDAGLFCPSGTMTNQIGIKALTQAQDELICYEGAHIYKYEGGGLFFLSGVSVQLLPGNRGRLEAAQIARHIQPDNVHYPRTRVVALENTVNRAGGAVYSLTDIAPIAALCQEKGLKLHLDGARIFNALQASGDRAGEYGAYFDTISVCLSKGLGCPVGSVLLGRADTILYAKRIRKALGGGMRQAGFLAAAGLYALTHHVERLVEDHRRARIIGEHLAACAFVEEILPVETNIVIFRVATPEVSQKWVQYCRQHGIKVGTMDGLHPRLVTHLDFDDAQLEYFLGVLRRFAP
ncbi:MAG: GntG family PLP-dependent aldolase [Microscillaceae bacterium]